MALKKQTSQSEQVSELVNLVRDLVIQQNSVLKTAMETQQAQAEVLSKWIGMFTPQAAPHQSTSEEDRIRLREQMDADDNWEPVPFNPLSLD